MQLLQLYKKLLNHFGPQKWWPADEPFEVVVGAVLTQRTNWRNVEKAIKNLKAAKMLNPEKLATVDLNKIEKLIRPSGFYKQKAERLKTISIYISNNKINNLMGLQTQHLREELLKIKGVGKETADSILLYALEKPVFVVDAYTQRIFERVGIVKNKMTYDELQSFIEDKIDRNATLYKEFHALIVLLGKEYCKTDPICNKCPLECEYLLKNKI